MASQRITVRVPKDLSARLLQEARARGRSASDVLRIALQAYLGREHQSQSTYELAKQAGLIGCARRAPKDLSTNRRHFKGFGTQP